MATPAFVQINEGTGKRLAAVTYTENGQTVYDEKVIQGEHYLPTYTVIGETISVGTTSDHVLQIMAGASLNLRLRAIHLEQRSSATTANLCLFELVRLTTAGTGGTAITPGRFDPSDAAAGATAQSRPTAKGTESTVLLSTVLIMRQAISATQTQPEECWDWTQKVGSKPIIVPAGTSNGIAIKLGGGVPGATVDFWVEFVETSF